MSQDPISTRSSPRDVVTRRSWSIFGGSSDRAAPATCFSAPCADVSSDCVEPLRVGSRYLDDLRLHGQLDQPFSMPTTRPSRMKSLGIWIARLAALPAGSRGQSSISIALNSPGGTAGPSRAVNEDNERLDVLGRRMNPMSTSARTSPGCRAPRWRLRKTHQEFLLLRNQCNAIPKYTKITKINQTKMFQSMAIGRTPFKQKKTS